jgi:hypothetical protein
VVEPAAGSSSSKMERPWLLMSVRAPSHGDE